MSTIKVQVQSNKREVQRLTAEAIQRGLESAGMEAVTLTHRLKEQGGTPVVTGRLKNSIAWAVGNASGGGKDGGGEDKPLGTVEDGVLVIGSNVEYAELIEEGRQGGGGAHMLRNAINDVAPKAEKILKASIEAALGG